jgi:hypothetical protein
MENSHLEDNITAGFDASRKYINARIKLFKLELLERLSRVVSLIIFNVLVFIVGCLCVMFLCIAGAIFLGHLLHNLELGFLIFSALFLLIVIVIIGLRKKLIINQVIHSLDEILFPENDTDDEEN